MRKCLLGKSQRLLGKSQRLLGKSQRLLMIAALAGLGIATGVPAQVINITNPSFEANLVPAGEFQVFNPLGWARYDPGGIVNLVERAREVDFDTVSLFASAVPEPGSYAMFLAGLGLIITVGARRRLRAQA